MPNIPYLTYVPSSTGVSSTTSGTGPVGGRTHAGAGSGAARGGTRWGRDLIAAHPVRGGTRGPRTRRRPPRPAREEATGRADALGDGPCDRPPFRGHFTHRRTAAPPGGRERAGREAGRGAAASSPRAARPRTSPRSAPGPVRAARGRRPGPGGADGPAASARKRTTGLERASVHRRPHRNGTGEGALRALPRRRGAVRAVRGAPVPPGDHAGPDGPGRPSRADGSRRRPHPHPTARDPPVRRVRGR